MSTLNQKVAAMQGRPLVVVKYCGLQTGGGFVPSRALFNVVAGPLDLIHSTRTVESLEAEGYEVRELGQGNVGQGNYSSDKHSSDSISQEVA